MVVSTYISYVNIEEISSEEKFQRLGRPGTAENIRQRQLSKYMTYIYIYSHFHENLFQHQVKILVVNTDIVGDQLDSN